MHSSFSEAEGNCVRGGRAIGVSRGSHRSRRSKQTGPAKQAMDETTSHEEGTVECAKRLNLYGIPWDHARIMQGGESFSSLWLPGVGDSVGIRWASYDNEAYGVLF